jgi:predicted nucleic acid-binding protein
MIYLDTSVALAHLLAEDREPPVTLWRDTLVASRLVEYELWVRLNARGLARSHGEPARQLLDRVATLELVPAVLARALEPFPAPVRTLDALHLASIEFLRSQHQQVELATYDTRMAQAARSLGIPLFTA